MKDHTPVVIPDGFKITKLPTRKAAGLYYPRSSGALYYGVGDRRISLAYCNAKVRGANAAKGAQDMRYFKVGGLRFLRLGRLQFSWCMVRKARA